MVEEAGSVTASSLWFAPRLAWSFSFPKLYFFIFLLVFLFFHFNSAEGRGDNLSNSLVFVVLDYS